MHDIQTTLARWRAAERRFGAAAPGSPGHAMAEQECNEAHAAYERLVEGSSVRRDGLDDTDRAGSPGPS